MTALLDLATLPASALAHLARQAEIAGRTVEAQAAAILSAAARPASPTRGGLTPKQAELLAFIVARISETGIAPSYDEMTSAVGLRSKSGIVRLIAALEERGWIRRLPNRTRAIEVVR